ncbi:amidohydrolase [Actinomadura luteofluorescens]|uniref:Amidohydrolase n=1 Tax=Actinomadura luteofluorescens TaxID=46163 RepID=A0A7Y9ER89_9ACTN|nr:M20 family metallopeptidase [Actinomadura luteofluorescens]NYD51620.1 amidohydrolase [Actinomadura luteofluorescens]
MGDLAGRLFAALGEEIPQAVELRRRLHANPEPGGAEHATAERVAAFVREPGVIVAETGRLLRVGPVGPTIAVRAELDALPINERTGVPWAARAGYMHACGHDVHLAALAALLRAARSTGLPVLGILQPREEVYPSGALDVARDAALAAQTVRAYIAVHVHPGIPDGTVAVDAGPINAAADEFTITIKGHGGHGAYPHLAADPVLALCQCVTAIQQLVSRHTDPTHAAVVTVGELSAGTAPNVIPEEVRSRGTIRTLHPDDRDRLHKDLIRTVEHTAAAHGCAGAVEMTPGEPVLNNDPGLSAAVRERLHAQAMPVSAPLRSCGADDFSYFGALAPAVMMFAGVSSAGAALHHAEFLPADDAVELTARAMAAGVLAALPLVDDAWQ